MGNNITTVVDYPVYITSSEVGIQGVPGVNGDSKSNLLSGYINTNLVLTPVITNSIQTNLSDNSFYIHTGNSQNTWTLPLISISTGKFYFIKNRGFSLILSGQNNDMLFITSQQPSFTIYSGESYIIVNDGHLWNVM